MIRRMLTAAMVPLLGCVTGCGIGGLLGGSTALSVELVNDSDYAVEVTAYTSEEDDIPASLIDDVGREHSRTIAAGQTARLTFNCDDARAIVIDRASLSVVGGLGPVTQTDVLRDESDFACGDTLVFTFDHTSIVFDFAVTTSVRMAAPPIGGGGSGIGGGETPSAADLNVLLDILLAILQIVGR